MRIACIHIPQFALQSATRVDPALRGEAVAVVSGVTGSDAGRQAAGVLHAPIVLACSRAAWAQGVRLGMTVPAVRSLSSDIRIVTGDAAVDRETVRAIADTLLGISAVVDTGGRVGAGGPHLAMYAEVPAKTRGSTFGDRVLELLEEVGVTARVGIADDRFTAWVAAAHSGHEERGVITVPRGGSAAFLAPRSLSLLAISPEVQHMLEALGVRTLGEFAALPAPSVARPIEADYQALARGESDALLRPYTPEAPIREEVTVSGGNVLELEALLPASEHAAGLSVAAAIALVARRIHLRLEGRARAAARLDITALGRDGTLRELPVTLAQGAWDADELGHVIANALEPVSAEHTTAHDDWRVRVVVAGEAVRGSEGTEMAEMAQIFGEGSQPYAHELYVASATTAADRVPTRRDISTASRVGATRHARHRHAADHPSTEPLGPLAVVLSSSGSLFALSPPGGTADRRDVHRRTRRGKQRRTRPTALAQPRLFDRTSSK